MPTVASVVVHSEVTERNHYTYQFTPKHHGAVLGAAQWLPSLSLDEEFEVFNVADRESICDDRGWSVSELAPDNRRGQKMRPDPAVFDKMEAAGMLSCSLS